ncbi:MAG: DUF6350 family protein [Friedmanniella sp.]
MASLLSPRRTQRDLVLRATTPAEPKAEATVAAASAPRLGWALTAVAGGLLCAVTGWLLVAGLTVLGWLAADPGTLGGALAVGTQLWLAGQGVGVELGGVPVTLVPWGIAVLAAFLLSRCAAVAARAARPGQRPTPGRIALVLLGAYLVPVLVGAVLVGSPGLAPGHILAVLAVLGGAALRGAGRTLAVGWTGRWPAWSRSLPRAVLTSQLVLLAAGAAVLCTGLALHLDRVGALQDALAPGPAGGVALLAAQLALMPNAVVWATAYALGGGFTLGNGSVVAPAGTDIGILPGLPLLGALPAAGPGPAWALCWLAAGVLAGAVAAWLVVRGRPEARFDETSLVGGIAGVLGGLVLVGLAWATSGDLGTLRLSGLGPLLLPLLVMAVTTLGLSGMVTGLLLGLWRRSRRHRPAQREDRQPEPDGEATQVLHRTGAGAGADAELTQVLPVAGPVPSEDQPSSG